MNKKDDEDAPLITSIGLDTKNYLCTLLASPVGNEKSSKQVLNFSRKLFAGKIAAGKLWVDQKSVIFGPKAKSCYPGRVECSFIESTQNRTNQNLAVRVSDFEKIENRRPRRQRPSPTSCGSWRSRPLATGCKLWHGVQTIPTSA